jgi:hypothetical protein
MCRLLKTEPLEEEIPVGREDLTLDTQFVFNLYDKLPAKWEGFGGTYLGKELILLPVLFKEFDIDKSIQLYCWDLIPFIDYYIAEDIAKKVKAKSKEEKLPGGG